MRVPIRTLGLFVPVLAILVCGVLCAQDQNQDQGQKEQSKNVLLVVVDDIGNELIGCCAPSSNLIKTPRLDAFARAGIRFENVWSNPVCSPTRATIITGRYGFRTGIGAVLGPNHPVSGLTAEEVCIPEALRDVAPNYRTALIGKWHLGVRDLGPDAPRLQGFGEFHGTLGNLADKFRGDTYFKYQEVHNGKVGQREGYATTATVDDTLAAIKGFGEDPWFVIASFHAAHKPLHAPPQRLHSFELSGEPFRSRGQHLAATVEAFDTEFGRLLDGLPDEVAANTTIIVVADNGSSGWAHKSAGNRNAGKGSLFEYGICVPMFVGGAGVVDPGRVVSHPINTTDLFGTVIELCAGSADGGTMDRQESKPVGEDSISIVPYLKSADAPALREWIMAERFLQGKSPDEPALIDRVAVKFGAFKRIEDCVKSKVRLYDLDEDPGELHDLLREGAEPSPEALAALVSMESVLKKELARKL